MKKSIGFLLLAGVLWVACGGQSQPSPKSVQSSESENQIEQSQQVEQSPQIADYIRNIYQDKNGNFWFGTNSYGVAHYNGVSISYYSNDQGFSGRQITGITEDTEKNIWFATDQGVVKCELDAKAKEGKRFINYSDFQYFGGQRFWSICADSKGGVWAGAVTGIYRYDGVSWSQFELPYPEEITGQFITRATSWSIIEDSAGDMWFSTNGFGAFKYDGKSFTQYSKADGLTDNDVDVIIEDKQKQIWFGTRYGGVSRYDGKAFTNYTARNNKISNDEVCALYEDSKGNIWMSSEGYGVYRYNPVVDTISNYSSEQGLGVRAVQTIFEDKEGRLWVGGGGGLYRLEGERFVNVRSHGPWE